MTKNGKFRKKKVYFTQVSNVAIRDKNLSLKAKGLYALIQSYLTIEDFVLYKSTLKKNCSEGETAFESTWKELKEKRYLIQYRLKNEAGQFYYEYELMDSPLEEEITIQEENQENKQEEIPKNSENHTPKTMGMDNIQGGDNTKWEKGVHNNTDSNNTDLNNTNINLSSSIKEDKKELTDEELKEKIQKLKEETLGAFKYYDYKKLIKASKGDIDLVLYVYENTLNIASDENPIRNLVAYMLKSIENELS